MKTFNIKSVPRIRLGKIPKIISLVALFLIITAALFQGYAASKAQRQELLSLQANMADTQAQLEETATKLAALEAEDQYQINQQLQQNLSETEKVFQNSIKVYEKLIDNRKTINSTKVEKEFAAVLDHLSKVEYASAASKLTALDTSIDQAIVAAQATSGIDIASLTVSNAPPDSGYQRQRVSVDGQDYVVDVVAADLGSTRVIVDTASDSDCADNCPVLPLATYVARNGAFAGINGTYFCPASYPSCAGKTNSFDLLVMNKNKTYFNSDNNVYSTNPAVIFMGSSIRFVGQALEWGRDTGIDSMLSNYPLLVMGGQSQFGGDSDPKKSSIATRPFVASKGSKVYIGVVRGVNVATAAKVLQTMGMDNALNLDSGGSTAFFANGGYKAGPGRDIPNAILFVRK